MTKPIWPGGRVIHEVYGEVLASGSSGIPIADMTLEEKPRFQHYMWENAAIIAVYILDLIFYLATLMT